ncbi:HNH endonuclease signature motif containing protein [Corynebacterium renale]|uniref:HNH endonuclease n=2 Tax=Corynebacterium renale TaxID=1724 RepID=A0A2A9DML6_9CORY|nr:HNH endonuclease signature motif containing protein [Corynebacterium renale]PFG27843.1 HNH endonuclease [Corynebacterium renale]SQI22032.1 Endonuclease [Corynebacterium renale]
MDIFTPLTQPLALFEAAANKDYLKALGLPTTWITTLTKGHEVFFKRTRFSRYQQRCLASARKNGHTLATLAIIAGANFKKELHAWQVREELCRMEPDATKMYAHIRTRREALEPPPARTPEVTTKHYSDGMASMTITGDNATIHDLRAHIHDYDDVEKLFDGNLSRQPTTTTAVLTLDELDQIIDGDGEEITIRLTNGATITGADYVNRVLADRGYLMLAHPEQGPVNLYRLSRFASDKQREMAAAENPTCAWPDCNKGADFCQVHHITAWKDGGDTNMKNLVKLCEYHNSINDDARLGNGRGYIERTADGTVWISPYAYANAGNPRTERGSVNANAS